MYDLLTNALIADTPVEAFAAALLHQRKRDGWCHSTVSALDGEGVVIAGIVLQLPSSSGSGEDKSKYMCVSLGSGTRCVGYEQPTVPLETNLLLRDGHAEVMARRGFVAFLLDAADYLAQDKSREHLFVERRFFSRRVSAEFTSEDGLWCCFRLRAGVTVHLVCTEYPCGAMSIPRGGGHVLLRTPGGHSLMGTPVVAVAAATAANGGDFDDSAGCAVLCHGHVIAAHRSHPADGLLLVGRVKPGKGRQNLSMSCSDKLLRWHCLGLQGRRRTRLFPERIRLACVWLPDMICDVDRSGSIELSSSLETASKALNDRRHHFCPAVSLASRDSPSNETKGVLPQVPIPPVDISGFTPSSLRALLGSAEREDAVGDDSNMRANCCWSRSAWVTMVMRQRTDHTSAVGTKRQRVDDTDEDGWHFLSWEESNAAVLNTKAGLPRGVTRQCMTRILQELSKRQPCFLGGGKPKVMTDAMEEAMVGRFPLSRAWMACRQQRVMHNITQHQQDAGTKTPALAECRPDNKDGEGVVPSLSVPVILVPVGELEGHEAVVAGGSAHYWLQQARMCSETTAGAPRDGEDARSFPLLWVEKGTSV